jgi:protein TonB
MKIGWLLGIIGAVALHAAFILFGGVLLPRPGEDQGTLREIDLLGEDVAAEEEAKPEDATPEDELTAETEAPPDAAEIVRDLEAPVVNDAPALEAASLAAIEAALSGRIGAGDFAHAVDFSSGGRIGGTGRPNAVDEKLDEAFSLAEIDQQPRAIFQATPIYPAALRSKKLEGVVSVIFVVDAAGKVTNARAESSSHSAFEKPAVDAVRKWKFEPAVKGGARVACNMRVSIRFEPS